MVMFAKVFTILLLDYSTGQRGYLDSDGASVEDLYALEKFSSTPAPEIWTREVYGDTLKKDLIVIRGQ